MRAHDTETLLFSERTGELAHYCWFLGTGTPEAIFKQPPQVFPQDKNRTPALYLPSTVFLS